MTHVTRRVLPPLLFLFALPMYGCGPGKANVSGTVTLDSKPLYAGTIVFIPASGPAVSAEVKEGKYTVAGVPVGEAKVTVDNKAIKMLADQARKTVFNSGPPMASKSGPPPGAKMSPEAKAALDKQMQGMKEAAQRNKEMLERYVPVPEKYADPNGSGLTYKVGSGANTFNPELKSH